MAAAVALGCATEQEPTSAQQRVAAGHELFQTYCIACHGANGAGGPLATYLAPPPPDLRGIAARNGGRFPHEKVESWIDGRDRIPSHGTRDMPAWGPKFREETRIDEGTEARVHARIVALVAYLETIQQP
jgi:mono/diheme cytochrome c family protein